MPCPPIDWREVAIRFEDEGSVFIRKSGPMANRRVEVTAIVQDEIRKELVFDICEALNRSGIRASVTRAGGPTILHCRITRAQGQKCFLERVRPFVRSVATRRKIDKMLRFVEGVIARGRTRPLEDCPESLF